MKNFKLFKKFNEKIFNDEHFKIVYPKDFNIDKIFMDMDKYNETEKKIDGVGTFIYNRDTTIPYIMYVPEVVEDTDRMVFEANNCEKDDREAFMLQAISTVKDNNDAMPHPVPIVVPLIPSIPGKSYYQQISPDYLFEKDGLDVSSACCEIMDDALDKIEEISGVRLPNKVFLNGYSSSGVFAQRFCLLHPERIDTAVIGGASGSIPCLDKDIDYPLGIGSISNFNMDEYKKIKFRYYVGEFELIDPANNRMDIINGVPTKVVKPMHDMTYFPRSVPMNTGKKYRDKYGEDYFDRTTNIVNTYIRNGFDIRSTVLRGRAHRNMTVDGKFYKGTRDDSIPIIQSAYRASLVELRNNKYRKKLG